MHLTSQTLTTFEPPEVKVKAGFTVRASGLWCQMLATLVNRSDRDTQVSHVIWVGSRPCDVSRLSNNGVVIWPTFVFSFNLVLFQWHRDTGLPIPAKDMERICSHLMSDGRHWFCSWRFLSKAVPRIAFRDGEDHSTCFWILARLDWENQSRGGKLLAI